MFWWKKVEESGAQRGEINWNTMTGNIFMFFFSDNADFSWPSVFQRLRVGSLRSSTNESKKKKKLTGIEGGNGREKV